MSRWREEIPEREGWYWWCSPKRHINPDIQVVLIERQKESPRKLLILLSGDSDCIYPEFIKDTPGYWLGPLVCPEVEIDTTSTCRELPGRK